MKAEIVNILNEGLEKSLVKKPANPRMAALAISNASASWYLAGNVESNTNLLAISAEQMALCMAAQEHDYEINEVVAMHENNDGLALLSPQTQMVMTDFARRTGTPIAYKLLNTEGEELFACDDIASLAPYYRPEVKILGKFAVSRLDSNWRHYNKKADHPKVLLKQLSLAGLKRSFTTSDQASSYGSAVLTNSGKAYFSGQYSSYEGSTNIHAEMGAALAAIMHGHRGITHIGVLSTRHKETPCDMCGCCRQFFSELNNRLKINPQIYTFASETDIFQVHTIDRYLPSQWRND